MTPVYPDALIADYVCCRVWPCVSFVRVGKCGICGERPKRMTDD